MKKKAIFLFVLFEIVTILTSAIGQNLVQPTKAAAPNPKTFIPVIIGGTSKGTTPPPASPGSWIMAGGNPQRTSWTSTEVRGSLNPIWYRVFEPYILPKVQIITANDTLYISTEKGLYALDAETGDTRWVYPTELPLGDSPTINNNIAYVGGFDHKIHAINALTGQGLWTFEAGAGFETNPLVVDGKVFMGNRDGWFYAVSAEGTNAGQLAWKFQTNGPILYSAAYKDGVVFFASNDSYAYALNGQNGALVWKSNKLPGAGFQSWWPVVYQDRVIFTGSTNYRTLEPGIGAQLTQIERVELYPNNQTDPKGTLIGSLGTIPGNWVSGTPTINANRITSYLTQKPWRKTVFVLDRFTGQERELAPVLWTGTHSGNRFPPVVGSDGVLYQQNNYMSDPFIPGGQLSGWTPGSQAISVISSDWAAIDEPHAAAGGGNLIYWNLCCDRQAGAVDITKPNSRFASRYNSGIRPPTGDKDNSREWFYFSYDLQNQIPGYNTRFFNITDNHGYGAATAVYGSSNGVYGFHGDQNPPVPYNGKVYMHRSNTIIAFGPLNNPPIQLPEAEAVSVPTTTMSTPSVDELKTRLANEVQKIIQAGHLQPGYNPTGLFDSRGKACADSVTDYWHNPADTLYTLILALPFLTADLQTSTRAYLQNEFAAFPATQFNDIGWKDGVQREAFDRPPEFESDRVNYPPQVYTYNFDGWNFSPFAFYGLWKYAQEFGNAKPIFDAVSGKLEMPPADSILLDMPHVVNAYIAGYTGYLALQQMAGYAPSGTIQSELNRLKTFRVNNFSAGSTADAKSYCRALIVARNFMYMVPELADYLQANALPKVQSALNGYYQIAPYWFVPKTEITFGEGVIQQLYDSYSIYQTKALILHESRQELTRYLDVPAMQIGDLFYIQKLVSAIQAP